jgi:hypothetical protein
MPFCESCGERLEPHNVFCTECGVPVDGPLGDVVVGGGNVAAAAPSYRISSPYGSAGRHPGVKQRHIALTIYLWFLIVANTFVTIWYTYWLIQLGRLAEAFGASVFNNWQAVVVLIMTIGYAVDIVAPIALLKWKRWGFWYSMALFAFAFVFNLATGTPLRSVLNLVGAGILFGFLQLGGEKRAWPQLD